MFDILTPINTRKIMFSIQKHQKIFFHSQIPQKNEVLNSEALKTSLSYPTILFCPKYEFSLKNTFYRVSLTNLWLTENKSNLKLIEHPISRERVQNGQWHCQWVASCTLYCTTIIIIQTRAQFGGQSHL